MKILGLLLTSFAELANIVLEVYMYLIFVAALLSWVRPDPYNPLVRVIRQLTEPVFHYARRILPRALNNIGLDLSPMLVLFAIILLRNILVRLLFEAGLELRAG